MDSTRLIVKGLPAQITEAQLRKAFEPFGQLTDVNLKHTAAGKSRRFAFIGFCTPEECRKAVNGMNNGYVHMAKVLVEECRPLTAELKQPVAWKSRPPAKNASPSKPQSAETNPPAPTSSSQLDQFITHLTNFTGDRKLSLIFRGLPAKMKASRLKDWLLPMRMKSMKMVNAEKEAFAIVTFERAPDVRRALKRSGQELGGKTLLGSNPQEVALTQLSHVYHLGAAQVHPYKTKDIPFKIEILKLPDAGSETTSKEESSEKKLQKFTQLILDTGRLFLRNLPFVCRESDLRPLLERYGQLADLQCIVDKATGQCRGYAIATFIFPEHALKAYTELDGSIFKGRMLHVLPGEEAKSEGDGQQGGSRDEFALSKFQKQRRRAVKDDAASGGHSWNALFLGPNAVAESVAEKLEVEKRDLMVGDEETSAAIRLAMAETRLVKETRDFLLAHGIRLDAFSRPPARRSLTVLLVKNLPPKSVGAEELQRMFARFGQVRQVLLPPGGGALTAIVEMIHRDEAAKAFKALAYVRLRHQPIYLEWAPDDCFDGEHPAREGIKNEEGLEETPPTENPPTLNKRDKLRGAGLSAEEKKALRRSKKHQTVATDPVTVESPVELPTQMDPPVLPSAEGSEEAGALGVLFVKNLSFATTDEQLYEAFSQHGYAVKSAVVSKKLDPSDPKKTLSMGFGFVHFERADEAMEALKGMQGLLLDGHSIELKLSNQDMSSPSNQGGKKEHRPLVDYAQGECTKLLVRNIPFQATLKELTQLFSTFGELKMIRLPKKIGPKGGKQHRGFCFVDYVSKTDAGRAMGALVHSTHLYGRRLVLEWAKQESTVAEMIGKTAVKMRDNKARRATKRKLQSAVEGEAVKMLEEYGYQK